MNLLWHAARQLAHMAPPCAIYKELLAICNHKENTIQPTHRIYPSNPPTNTKNQHTFHRTKALSSKRSQECCPRGLEKSTRNLDKGQTMLYTLPPWIKSLARSNQSKAAKQHDTKAGTKVV